MTQENAKQEYVLPQDVDYTKPFKFVTGIDGGIVYSIDNFRKGRVEVTWEGAHTDYSSDSIKCHIKYGDWKVLKEPQEDLFGSTFQFDARGGNCICTYTKQSSGNPRVEWAGISTTRYSEEDCRQNIANGDWTILPTAPKQPTSAPKQFDEESFKEAEQMVSEALKPTVEAVAKPSESITIDIKSVGMVSSVKVNIPANTNMASLDVMTKLISAWNTHEQPSLEAPDNMLNIIKKACTASQGRIVVQVNKDGYEVFHHYFYVDSVKVENESKLKVLLEALCLVDSMDSWENM